MFSSPQQSFNHLKKYISYRPILDSSSTKTLIMYILRSISGADPGFQVREGGLKIIAPSEGGSKIVGVFCVKNHDLRPKKSYFFQF